MTREEKIEKIVNKCRRTSHCGTCKLYGHYSMCPVQQYIKDGATITNWGVDRVYEILFEETRKEFTKADLKTGMVCELRNEDAMYVIKQEEEVFFIDKDGALCKCFNDNLQYIFEGQRNKEYDVVRIYSAADFSCMEFLGEMLSMAKEVVWERQEAREITIEEIEKELGYKIKIVAPPVGKDS